VKDVWLRIEYRDFYDIPRAFIVEYQDAVYFFDCPFDADLDEYPEQYTVYRIPVSLPDAINAPSWAELPGHGIRVAQIRTGAVEFDPTKRGAVRASVFDLV